MNLEHNSLTSFGGLVNLVNLKVMTYGILLHSWVEGGLGLDPDLSITFRPYIDHRVSNAYTEVNKFLMF